MADIVNLRRARKSKSRDEREKDAAANRAKHGASKYLRDNARANVDREVREHESRKLECDKN